MTSPMNPAEIAAMVDEIDAKLASQIGDDVRRIYDHEALFKDARKAINTLSAKLAAVTAERDAAVAQAEKSERERDDASLFLDNAISKAPEPLIALGEWLANLLDEDDWPTAERYLNAAIGTPT